MMMICSTYNLSIQLNILTKHKYFTRDITTTTTTNTKAWPKEIPIFPQKDTLPALGNLSRVTQEGGGGHNRNVVEMFSYVKGPTNKPLLMDPIGLFWQKQLESFQNTELLVSAHQNIRWSWKDIDKQANALAKGLMRLGFQKGDTLGIWLPNNAEWLVCQIATAKIGVILVNLNPGYRLVELKHSINLVGIKGIVIIPKLKNSDFIHLFSQLIPNFSSFKHKIESPLVPSLQYVIQTTDEFIPGTIRYQDILCSSEHILDKTLQINDPINIQFTSGTTGSPKGTILTHNNILNNGYFTGERLNLSPQHILCVPVPLFHCFGCIMANLAAITHGSKLVYPSSMFDAGAVLDVVEKEKCTTLHGVPTMFIALLQHPSFTSKNLITLENGIMAGAPCPVEIMKKVIDQMHLKGMTICYGMTETSPVSFQTNIFDSLKHRCETVGTVHDHVEVKIIDTQGNIVPIGQSGELCTRGYSVMLGYWNNPEKTKDVIDSEGWMHTGDLGIIDEEGFCRIVGRIKDVIIRGGENIFPREVEEFLYTHPEVADVQVIGVPDEKYGEEVCACIIPKPNADSTNLTVKTIEQYCRGKIASYKIPRYVVLLESFPMTVSGKVQKYKLKQEDYNLKKTQKTTTTTVLEE